MSESRLKALTSNVSLEVLGLGDLKEYTSQIKLPNKPKILSFLSDEAYQGLVISLGAGTFLASSYWLYRYITVYSKCVHVIVVGGPRGAGKSTLIERLMENYPAIFAIPVQHTDSVKGAEEVEGQDAYFVSQEEMSQGIDRNEFVEFQDRGSYLVGTKKSTVNKMIRKRKICIVSVDSDGVETFKKSKIPALYISVTPPSVEAWETRLKVQKSASAMVISRRKKAVEEEMEKATDMSTFDAIILNDDAERAYQDFEDACAPVIEHLFAHYRL